MFQGLLPEIQGQDLALTVLYVPHSLGSGNSHVMIDSHRKSAKID